ncbi:hypothetical protein [Aneurinibacillus thermoaerophilus]|jgi:hypothetical protein|uniref:hypothetical protein n=1 Tax=Aneurinibacillus thermoaerophilus TaxID=143495 RepID=UPI002E1F7DA2|nr:hypothetical protein [Aneurinibacillus thermoaerophilus]
MSKAAAAMKKAWEIFRKKGVRTMAAWAESLRAAWAIVKGFMSEFPELKGTEKQVAWATDIRKVFVENVDRAIEPVKTRIEEKISSCIERGKMMTADGMKTVLANLIATLEDAKKQDSAVFWIDNFQRLTERFSEDSYEARILKSLIYNGIWANGELSKAEKIVESVMNKIAYN